MNQNLIEIVRIPSFVVAFSYVNVIQVKVSVSVGEGKGSVSVREGKGYKRGIFSSILLLWPFLGFCL